MNADLITLSPVALQPFIDWNFLFVEWDLHGHFPEIFTDPKYGTEARKLYDDSRQLLLSLSNPVHALYAKVPAKSRGDDIVLSDGTVLPQLRNQTNHFKCLSDYVEDTIVLFAITTRNIYPKDDCYLSLVSSILCDRLADAMITYLERKIASEFSLSEGPLSIAYGYPAAPDHSGKRLVYNLLDAGSRLDLHLTENYSMDPTSSVIGFMIPRDGLQYFNVGRIGEDQLRDYSRRSGLSLSRLAELLPNNL